MENTRYINHWSNAYLDWGADLLFKAKEIIDRQEDCDEVTEELGQAILMGMDAIDEVLRIREEEEAKAKAMKEYLPF